MPEAFEQRTGESAKAFAAFSLYLSLGEKRSLAAVAKKLGKSNALIERWSARHGWIARVDAYAGRLAVVEAEAQGALVRVSAAQWLARQQEARQEEWAIHEEMIRAGREGLKRFYKKGNAATLGDIARILEFASRLGRLASGLATDKTEVTGEDGGPIEVALSAALAKIYGQVVDVEEIGKQKAESRNEAQRTEDSGQESGQRAEISDQRTGRAEDGGRRTEGTNGTQGTDGKGMVP